MPRKFFDMQKGVLEGGEGYLLGRPWGTLGSIQKSSGTVF